MATPRCMVPTRPDVSTPRITLGCDQIIATQEVLAGGVIRFDCATGVKLGAPMLVNKDTVIDGRGVVFDGQDITGIFRVTNSARLTLLDVTVTRGFVMNESGAGVRLDSGAIVAFDSTFTDNDAPATGGYAGGAISAQPALATVEIYGGLFRNNTAANGGAVDSFTGLVAMNATFDSNAATGMQANGGGAGGALNLVGAGDTTLCGVTLTNNLSGFLGGAMNLISVDSSSIVQLTDVVVSSNRGAGAGAAYIQGSPALTMRRVSVTDNVSDGTGGLWIQNSTFTGENLSVIANRADAGAGAGLYITGSSGSIAFSTIADNVGNCPACPASAILGGANVQLKATIIVDNTSQTVPVACSETGVNGGLVWQWPNDAPLCVASPVVEDPLLSPRGNASGPAGTLLVRRPIAGSAAVGATMVGCPAEDVLGNPRPVPCAVGSVEPL